MRVSALIETRVRPDSGIQPCCRMINPYKCLDLSLSVEKACICLCNSVCFCVAQSSIWKGSGYVVSGMHSGRAE